MAADIFSVAAASSAINWTKLIFWGGYFLVIAGIGGIVVFFWRYPVIAHVYGRRGMGSMYRKRLLRIIEHDSRNKQMKFRFGGTELFPGNEYLVPTRGFFRRYCIHLIEDGAGNHHPIEIKALTNSQFSMNIAEQNARFWAFESMKDSKNLWSNESFLMKYAPQLMMLTFIVFIFVLSIVMLQKMDSVVTGFERAATALSSIGANLPPGG